MGSRHLGVILLPLLLLVLLKLLLNSVSSSLEQNYSNECNKGMEEMKKKKNNNNHNCIDDATAESLSFVIPENSWSHATNSIEKLNKALQDDSITSIEADVLMGHLVPSEGASQEAIPIMSHPPYHESDLSLSMFLSMTTSSKNIASSSNNHHDRVLYKNLKLDIKESNCVQPTLDELGRHTEGLTNPLKRIIYLNADILPGPGNRAISTNDYVSPTPFLQSCIDYVTKQDNKRIDLKYALSLGYKADYRSDDVYTDEDVASMSTLIHKFHLTDTNLGLVLALNARVLAERPEAFDSFLNEFPQSELLAWTGSREPKISMKQIEKIVEHFEQTGTSQRIGFDCDIEDDDDEPTSQ